MKLTQVLNRFRTQDADPTLSAVKPRYYHAVSIVPGRSSCPESFVLSRLRLLSREAPALPLPDCPTPERCACRFQKYDDRRQEERRDIVASGQWYGGVERRRTRGRRVTDR